jgi:hypothetical protein
MRGTLQDPGHVTETPATGEPWLRPEIDVVVDAYMDLLRDELAGRKPVKVEKVRRLQAELPARSSRSIEFKLQNISAVLDEHQLQWIDGYKPASHYQHDLVEPTLRAYRSDHRVAEAAIAYMDSTLPAPSPKRQATSDVLTSPPGARVPSGHRSKVGITTGAVGALLDFHHRQLGEAGERWVIDLEQEQLDRRGRRDLADRVRWVSRDDGDGAGYDIGSFREDGAELKIEVKTTNLSWRTPFYITRWEVEVSRTSAAAYALYRVYGFSRDPRLYMLSGSIEDLARLEPKVYLGIPL